jgi:hypothetical protein
MLTKSICSIVVLSAMLNVAAAQTGSGKALYKTGPTAGVGTVVAGLPDIMGTTLGFSINGYTAWGGGTTIHNSPQVKATKSGPNQDLCVIGTGMYRTFNKGDFAVGSFVDTVFVNGALVHTRHITSLAGGKAVEFENRDLLFREGVNTIQVKMDANNNIAESDENNTFQVTVNVQVDCNGDGYIAGSPQIKNAAPAPQGIKSAERLKTQ